MRRVLFAIIALATVVALTGCKKELSKEELTLNYLNEMANQKISGTFSFIKTNDYNLLSNYDLDYILNNQGELIETKQDYSINSTSFLIDNK